MIQMYPFNPDLNRHLDNAHYPKENTMQQLPNVLDVHAQALQEKRIHRMLMAEQMRAANVFDERPVRNLFTAFRNALGAILIASGKRLHGEAIEETRPPEALRRITGTA